MLSDLDIARRATLLPVTEIASRLAIPEDAQIPYGRFKSKVSLDFCQSLPPNPNSRLILVTAITPTPAGEGKTTAVIGLADALQKRGKKTALCLREPSMGPCFGIKGGAAGGGYAQVVPMEDINLHFNGDLHAIGCAHNLLSALLDNHLQQGNALDIEPRSIQWGRVVDMNDRALRHLVIGLGGAKDGIPRESSFDITVASEVMAAFCLSNSLIELRDRLGRIVVGRNRKKEFVYASDLKAHGAMTVLLKEAIQPNLVQTLEHTPAFIHGGPFANIAHGCNSVAATQLATRLADYVVTEAGFGADLGAEKFVDIKCRKSGLEPHAFVLVATIRALKFHGGMEKQRLSEPNLDALEQGAVNLQRHIENLKRFGRPILVALNIFASDTPDEIQALERICGQYGVSLIQATHHAHGSDGALDLADAVISQTDRPTPTSTPTSDPVQPLSFLYPDSLPLWDKIQTLATEIYRAAAAVADKPVREKLDWLQNNGFGALPICMAKTPYSFSADASLKGAPTGFDLKIRDVKLANGAGFVIAYAGDIMTMPGLPARPAAENIDIDASGNVVGLF